MRIYVAPLATRVLSQYPGITEDIIAPELPCTESVALTIAQLDFLKTLMLCEVEGNLEPGKVAILDSFSDIVAGHFAIKV
jgi:hypothetical protein